ncbi:MAG: hypothetical protein BGO31_17055 [Bacteroidetes bacterium 43-16]|nr:MAG: hypothetical protein BGO31_17055 [Bacteroidetes bacterium 43-16]
MIRYFIILKCLFLLLLADQWSYAQQGPQAVLTADSFSNGYYFTESWKFKAGDDPGYKKADWPDSTWAIVNSRYLKTTDSATSYRGIAWLRYRFQVDSSLLQTPLSIIIKQGGASEIYLDGTLLCTLGTVGTKHKTEYQTGFDHPYIFTLKDAGWHTLAVRYDNTLFPPGEKAKAGISLGIYEANNYYSHYLPDREDTVSILMLIVGVFVALSFIHLLLFVFYWKALYNLFFGLYNLSIAFLAYTAFTLSSNNNFLESSQALGWLFYGFLLFGLSITGFVNDLFGKRKTRFYILLIIALLLPIVYLLDARIGAFILIIYILFVVVEGFFVIIRAMFRRERAAFIVGGGIMLFFCMIALLIVGLVVNGGEIDTSRTSGWVVASLDTLFIALLVSFPISISAYLAWQFSNTSNRLKKQLDEVERLSVEKQQILEQQNEQLELQVSERTRELQSEKQKSDNLLLNILPQEVAEELKEKGASKAQYYDEVSVLFTDFVNFTAIAQKLGVEELLEELNANFTAFDQIMEKHGLEKIKTIGDAYLAVSGLPVKNTDHALNAAAAALDILAFVAERKKQVPYGLNIRIGIHSGSLIAGIVGVKKFAFDIWGDTVNTAARMEQSSAPGKINISENTYHLIEQTFNCTYRGKLQAKGKGEMDMYFVENKK